MLVAKLLGSRRLWVAAATVSVGIKEPASPVFWTKLTGPDPQRRAAPSADYRNDLRDPVSEPRFQRAFLASHFQQRGIELYKRAFHRRVLRVTLYTRGSSITSQRGRNLC